LPSYEPASIAHLPEVRRATEERQVHALPNGRTHQVAPHPRRTARGCKTSAAHDGGAGGPGVELDTGAAAVRTIYIDLVTDKGELVRIECPEKFEDALHDTLNSAMKRGDWWSPVQFDGCRMEYLGLSLDRVNMGKVVGEL
jgi:hypothetical protein